MPLMIVSTAGAQILQGQLEAGINELPVGNLPKDNYVLQGGGKAIIVIIQ